MTKTIVTDAKKADLVNRLAEAMNEIYKVQSEAAKMMPHNSKVQAICAKLYHASAGAFDEEFKEAIGWED